jgi:stage V sporulation protein B
MRKNANTLAENSLILMLSTILVKIISALFKIPLASDNFLGEVGFGYFSVAHDLYAPFYLLAITGLPTAVSHIVAQKVSNNADNDIINTFYSCRRLFTILGVIISLALILITLPLYLFLN